MGRVVHSGQEARALVSRGAKTGAKMWPKVGTLKALGNQIRTRQVKVA